MVYLNNNCNKFIKKFKVGHKIAISTQERILTIEDIQLDLDKERQLCHSYILNVISLQL